MPQDSGQSMHLIHVLLVLTQELTLRASSLKVTMPLRLRDLLSWHLYFQIIRTITCLHFSTLSQRGIQCLLSANTFLGQRIPLFYPGRSHPIPMTISSCKPPFYDAKALNHPQHPLHPPHPQHLYSITISRQSALRSAGPPRTLGTKSPSHTRKRDFHASKCQAPENTALAVAAADVAGNADRAVSSHCETVNEREH